MSELSLILALIMLSDMTLQSETEQSMRNKGGDSKLLTLKEMPSPEQL